MSRPPLGRCRPTAGFGATVGGMLGVLGGCYAPDVYDCVLPCETSADCADGQTCAAVKRCAAPGVMCPPPGAVPIAVAIAGAGMVAIGTMTCVSGGASGSAACTLDAQAGATTTAVALGTHNDAFAAWTSAICAHAPATCVFTPTGPTALAVTFAKPDD